MELAILLENYQHETLIFCTLPVLPLIRVTCYLIEISNIHPFFRIIVQKLFKALSKSQLNYPFLTINKMFRLSLPRVQVNWQL